MQTVILDTYILVGLDYFQVISDGMGRDAIPVGHIFIIYYVELDSYDGVVFFYGVVI